MAAGVPAQGWISISGPMYSCTRMTRPLGPTTATWIRRTRIDGDTWQSLEVPLGEAAESYQIRIEQSGLIRREATVTSPQFTYTAAHRTADGVIGPYDIAVAQISQTYGPGPFRKITV